MFETTFWQKKYLLTDSRQLAVPEETLFFAIRTARNDGARYIPELYEKGVRHFVTTTQPLPMPDMRVLIVPDPVRTLQELAAAHRAKFSIPILAITGSNGKTIVKEWLAQLLSADRRVIKSPRSYNSQIGVPLSVWQIGPGHDIGIFEAGISTTGEMARLEAIIRPDIGIFTNIGTAHDEGFASREEKIREKMLLFTRCQHLVYCADHAGIAAQAAHLPCQHWSWGSAPHARIRVRTGPPSPDGSLPLWLSDGGAEQAVHLPFSDPASVENALHCLVALLALGYSLAALPEKARLFGRAPAMRLELKQGVNGCVLVNDAYNNDLAGLKVALDFLSRHSTGLPQTLILSDLLETGQQAQPLYQEVADLLAARKISRLVGIGPALSDFADLFGGVPQTHFFGSTAGAVQAFGRQMPFEREAILLKGARAFGFEALARLLQLKVHGTRLEISLDAIGHNFNFFKSLLAPSTRLMVMVKAMSYGASTHEVARVLQYLLADYLAVAYADEGVQLREGGVRLPIMVMNPAEEAFEKMAAARLEPELYSPHIFTRWARFAATIPPETVPPVHLCIDTGMKRLGFEPPETDTLLALLRANPHVKVASVFTHLVAADSAEHEEFTRRQIQTYLAVAGQIAGQLGYPFLRHVLNSPGITRYPEAQLDMVRLGIGLHGLDVNGRFQEYLRPVATLKTTISQIKQVASGESVGYSRSQIADRPMTIATLPIGYADGFSRRLSNGKGWVLIKGERAPVVGRVCMDMTMVDITGIPAAEDDEVVVFGENPTLGQVAEAAGTIPYEVLTGVSGRVKRVFYAE